MLSIKDSHKICPIAISDRISNGQCLSTIVDDFFSSAKYTEACQLLKELSVCLSILQPVEQIKKKKDIFSKIATYVCCDSISDASKGIILDSIMASAFWRCERPKRLLLTSFIDRLALSDSIELKKVIWNKFNQDPWVESITKSAKYYFFWNRDKSTGLDPNCKLTEKYGSPMQNFISSLIKYMRTASKCFFEELCEGKGINSQVLFKALLNGYDVKHFFAETCLDDFIEEKLKSAVDVVIKIDQEDFLECQKQEFLKVLEEDTDCSNYEEVENILMMRFAHVIQKEATLREVLLLYLTDSCVSDSFGLWQVDLASHIHTDEDSVRSCSFKKEVLKEFNNLNECLCQEKVSEALFNIYFKLSFNEFFS